MIGESGEADLNDDATQNDRIGESKQFPNGEEEEEEDQVEEEEDLPPIFSFSLSSANPFLRNWRLPMFSEGAIIDLFFSYRVSSRSAESRNFPSDYDLLKSSARVDKFLVERKIANSALHNASSAALGIFGERQEYKSTTMNRRAKTTLRLC